jgi:hypothetical protein
MDIPAACTIPSKSHSHFVLDTISTNDTLPKMVASNNQSFLIRSSIKPKFVFIYGRQT